MKWKRDGYPMDGSKFEVIVKSSKGKRKTLALIDENYQRTAMLIKGTGGQYWRSFTEHVIAWRPIQDPEIGSIDKLKRDVETIEEIMEHYTGFGQVFDYEFGDVVNEVGTYEALHSMKISCNVMPTHISPSVNGIINKYENLIESRRWGLYNLYEYLKEMIKNV